MKSSLRKAMLAAAVMLLALPATASAQAQKFSSEQRSEIEGIIKDYLLGHPEVVQDVMAELEKRQQAAEDRLAADVHELLGASGRLAAQPPALPRCQYDHPHAAQILIASQGPIAGYLY